MTRTIKLNTAEDDRLTIISSNSLITELQWCQLIICIGSHWDLSSLKTQPDKTINLTGNRISSSTKAFIKENYDWNALTSPRLEKCLKILLNTKGTEDSPRTQSWNARHFWCAWTISMWWDQIWINESSYQRFEWPRLNLLIKTLVWRWNCSRALSPELTFVCRSYAWKLKAGWQYQARKKSLQQDKHGAVH